MTSGRAERRLSTTEAAARRGVKPATLYAYVSRGLLGRERSPDGRTSPFDPAEIDRLARPGRSRRGRRPATDLVVPSALTALDQGLPPYRGVAVTRPAGTRRGPRPPPRGAPLPLERIRVIAAALAAGDELRLELRPAAVTAAGRSLIAGLVDCLPRLGPPRRVRASA